MVFMVNESFQNLETQETLSTEVSFVPCGLVFSKREDLIDALDLRFKSDDLLTPPNPRDALTKAKDQLNKMQDAATEGGDVLGQIQDGQSNQYYLGFQRKHVKDLELKFERRTYEEAYEPRDGRSVTSQLEESGHLTVHPRSSAPYSPVDLVYLSRETGICYAMIPVDGVFQDGFYDTYPGTFDHRAVSQGRATKNFLAPNSEFDVAPVIEALSNNKMRPYPSTATPSLLRRFQRYHVDFEHFGHNFTRRPGLELGTGGLGLYENRYDVRICLERVIKNYRDSLLILEDGQKDLTLTVQVSPARIRRNSFYYMPAITVGEIEELNKITKVFNNNL